MWLEVVSFCEELPARVLVSIVAVYYSCGCFVKKQGKEIKRKKKAWCNVLLLDFTMQASFRPVA